MLRSRRLLPDRPEPRPSTGRKLWLLIVYVLRRWLVEDRCSALAARLTLQTLLSIVPLCGVALLVVGLMDEVAGTRLLMDLFTALIPHSERAAELARGALRLAKNVTLSNLGGLGFGVTIVLAFVLFSTLERIFNRIWRVTQRRGLVVKFTMFYTLATLGPALLLYSLAQPLLAGFSPLVAAPLLTSALGLTLLYRWLPYTPVRWAAAATGGLLCALLLELAKVLFGLYAAGFALATYEGVYGSLAMFPILLVWAQLSWLIILLGAEISYTVHRRHAIALQGYINRYVLDRHGTQHPTGRTAVRLLFAICDHHRRRQLGVSIHELGETFGMGLDQVGLLVEQLQAAGMVLQLPGPQAQVVPGRAVDQITVAEVLQRFDRDWTHPGTMPPVDALFRRLDAAWTTTVGTTTFADLLREQDDPLGSGAPAPPPL